MFPVELLDPRDGPSRLLLLCLLLVLADISKHDRPCFLCASHAYNLWYSCPSLSHRPAAFMRTNSANYPRERHVFVSIIQLLSLLVLPLAVLSTILLVSLYVYVDTYIYIYMYVYIQNFYLDDITHHLLHIIKTHCFQVHASDVCRHENFISRLVHG